MTWADYGQDLEANLHDLHARVRQGRYRAKPSRRVYIPKPDGRQRPLGIASLEDKIVQRAVVEVLDAIYEARSRRYEARSRRELREKLAALTPDEQAVMYVFHMEQQDRFKAGNDSVVAQKLRLARLVEYDDASGTGWMLYRVPTHVREVSGEFADAWAQVLASRGFTTRPALQALVARALDHNPI